MKVESSDNVWKISVEEVRICKISSNCLINSIDWLQIAIILIITSVNIITIIIIIIIIMMMIIITIIIIIIMTIVIIMAICGQSMKFIEQLDDI